MSTTVDKKNVWVRVQMRKSDHVSIGGYYTYELTLTPVFFNEDGVEHAFGTWSTASLDGLYMEGIALRTIIFAMYDPGNSIVNLGYKGYMHIDIALSKAMYETLRTLHTRLDKMNTKEGYAKTLGQHCWRFIRAIGAQGLIFDDEDCGGDKVCQRWTDASRVIWKIDYMAQEAHNELKG